MTNLTQQIAKQFKEVWFGGNWASVNLKETLANVTWQQATTKIDTFNTIATLVFHIKLLCKRCVNSIAGGTAECT